jgi:hypothetical protein
MEPENIPITKNYERLKKISLKVHGVRDHPVKQRVRIKKELKWIRRRGILMAMTGFTH